MTKICQEPYRKWIIDSSHAHEWEGLTIWENNGGDTHIVAHVVADHASQCDCEANARLIAAAPDLLAALEEAAEYYVRCNCGTNCIEGCTNERVRAAIAAAKGEDSA